MPNWRRKFSRACAATLLVGCSLASASALANDGSSCRLVAPAEVQMQVGEQSEFTVALVPKDGYAVSVTGPLRVSLIPEGGSGIEIRRAEFRRSQAVDPSSQQPRFQVSLRASEPGRSVLAVKARFWLCQAALCRPTLRELAVIVSADAPPGASPEPQESAHLTK